MADFADPNTLSLYSEYLERETMMPYDLIEKYVSDFAHYESVRRTFSKWLLKNHPEKELPFN